MIKPILIFCWTTVAIMATCLSLPGSLELLLLSLSALLTPRRRINAPGPDRWRVAVVVPAHNERLNIGACVKTLLRSEAATPGTEVEVFVVADNCTDDTAWLALQAGAQVLERNNSLERGKGYALHYAFSHLIRLGYDCMLVVDADTQTESNFVAAASNALRGGEQAVQARYLVHNAEENTRSRLMAFALKAFNVVRPLGREQLGVSCGIGGNGFGLRSETLLAVPYLAASIVEDLEYHIELVRSGRRVAFLDQATVFAETPVRAEDVKTQRSRWEGGRLRMVASHAPSLLGDVLRGKLRCLEPLVELLLLPLAFHVTLIALAMTSPLAMVRDLGNAGALIVLVHLVAAMAVGGGGWRDALILASAPFYILWKLLLIPELIRSSRANSGWVRTGRNAEQGLQPALREGK